MAETYFITGAQGCIGSWVVKTLVERGDIPVVFDISADARRLNAIIEPAELSKIRFITGDITDGEAVERALEQSAASKIIHLAGLQVPTCKANPVLGALVNVVGTLNLFEAARKAGVKHLVYASSAAVFGMSDSDEPLDEEAVCEPTTHYGVFKRTNEGNANVYFLDHGISSVGLRPLTVYGVNRDAGLTSDPSKAMKAAVLGLPFHIRFGGATDFQYAADTAAAFIASADRAPQGAFVFNLHGESVEVSNIVEIINELSAAPRQGLVTFGGPPIPIAPAMSDASIRKVIGDVPSMPLEKGISETMKRFAELRDSGRLDTSDLSS
jgi:nucleoside-diphosphate-sugar epimerase